jgi:hypothetical protein
MSAEATTTRSNPTRDLAASIFKDLVVNATEVNAEGVKMSASAENMAKLSMKLAEVFAKVEEEIREAGKPSKDTRIDAQSIADWMK